MLPNPTPWIHEPVALCSLPARCDVAIVGAGPAGLCLALLLGRAGVDVVVLEASATLGTGGFGPGPGLALGWRSDHPHRLVQALGPEEAAALQRFVEADHALAASLLGSAWRAREAVVLSGDAREAAEIEASLAVEGGPSCRALSPEVLASAHGLRSTWAGAARRPAASFSPAELLSALASLAREGGATICGGAPVRSMEESGPAPRLHTPRGVLEAELVVLCTGGGAAFEPVLQHWLTPVPQGVMWVDGPRGLGEGSPFSAWYGQLSVGPGDGGWLVAGGRCTADGSVLPAGVEAALLTMVEAALGGSVTVRQRWSCTCWHSRDGLPLVGPVPGRVRRLLCTGFGPHEADLAFAAAAAVGRGILGAAAELPSALESRRTLGSIG